MKKFSVFFVLVVVLCFTASHVFAQDSDGDGVLDDADNCIAVPNGPNLGTCTKITGDNRTVSNGQYCTSDANCDPGEFCEKTQEDNYPLGGNNIGDACECEADFNCDEAVAADDVATFLKHFGRSSYTGHPCTYDDPCYGDFDADEAVTADDVKKFLEDFGRSGFTTTPCPACTRPVGVLFAVHGGTTTVDSNEYLWNSGMQQFSYDPNHSVYKLVIWNPYLWFLAMQEESTAKFVGKYDFSYPQLGGTDPFESITVEQFTEMESALDSNPYGINFVSDWVGWMCGDCVDHLPYPRFIYYGPDGPDAGYNCTYCGEDEKDRVILAFSNGTSAFTAGATLTGQASGATAVIDAVTVDSGDWTGGNAAGFLSLSNTSALTVKFQDGEALQDDGTLPGLANAVGATRWPNCDPDRYDVDGPVERLLKQGAYRIIMVDLVMSGERFSKTYDIKEMTQKMLDDWKIKYGVSVPLLWVNDYSDLMGRSYPIQPEGWTRSWLGGSLPTLDSEVLLNGSPNPVASDPDMAAIWKDALESAWNPSVSDANTGVLILNHALHDNNEVFDPKIDDTIILNQNIKDLILDAHPGMDPDNFIGARLGIKEPNPETTHGKIERTRNMRGEDLGHQWMYESAKEPPPYPWGYLSWDALEYLKNQGLDHIVIGFTHIISASVLDLIEIPNQIAREIGTKTWLKDPLNGGSWDFTHYPTAGHPFADYWGNWVDQNCGEWELQFDNGTDEIEMNPDVSVTLSSTTGTGLIKEIVVTSGTWGSTAAGTITLKNVEGSFSDDQTIGAYSGSTLIGSAQANGTEIQTISTDCCFEMTGCADDPLPRPYPPPRLAPFNVRTSDMDPSLAYDLSDYGHLGYDPDPGQNNQYDGTWQMYATPDGDDRVGALLAKHVINAIIKPMVYLSNGETAGLAEGGSVTFAAHVVTGGTKPYTYEWSTNKDNAGFTTQGTGSSWAFNTTGGDAGTYAVRCVVTDSLSQTGEATWEGFVVSVP